MNRTSRCTPAGVDVRLLPLLALTWLGCSSAPGASPSRSTQAALVVSDVPVQPTTTLGAVRVQEKALVASAPGRTLVVLGDPQTTDCVSVSVTGLSTPLPLGPGTPQAVAPTDGGAWVLVADGVEQRLELLGIDCQRLGTLVIDAGLRTPIALRDVGRLELISTWVPADRPDASVWGLHAIDSAGQLQLLHTGPPAQTVAATTSSTPRWVVAWTDNGPDGGHLVRVLDTSGAERNTLRFAGTNTLPTSASAASTSVATIFQEIPGSPRFDLFSVDGALTGTVPLPWQTAMLSGTVGSRYVVAGADLSTPSGLFSFDPFASGGLRYGGRLFDPGDDVGPSPLPYAAPIVTGPPEAPLIFSAYPQQSSSIHVRTLNADLDGGTPWQVVRPRPNEHHTGGVVAVDGGTIVWWGDSTAREQMRFRFFDPTGDGGSIAGQPFFRFDTVPSVVSRLGERGVIATGIGNDGQRNVAVLRVEDDGSWQVASFSASLPGFASVAGNSRFGVVSNALFPDQQIRFFVVQLDGSRGPTVTVPQSAPALLTVSVADDTFVYVSTLLQGSAGAEWSTTRVDSSGAFTAFDAGAAASVFGFSWNDRICASTAGTIECVTTSGAAQSIAIPVDAGALQVGRVGADLVTCASGDRWFRVQRDGTVNPISELDGQTCSVEAIGSFRDDTLVSLSSRIDSVAGSQVRREYLHVMQLGVSVIDAGSADDAGTPDAGTQPEVDAGRSVDAGAPVPDAGIDFDAGPPLPGQYRVGCGCQSGEALLAALVLLTTRRRARR